MFGLFMSRREKLIRSFVSQRHQMERASWQGDIDSMWAAYCEGARILVALGHLGADDLEVNKRILDLDPDIYCVPVSFPALYAEWVEEKDKTPERGMELLMEYALVAASA